WQNKVIRKTFFSAFLKDVIQSEDVKPKLQYIMTNPSFSMVTVQSEDSGITWETSSSRCSTPWASETSTTSDLYSMESSPVGSPPGKVIFIMDEGKIVRKRKHKLSNRAPMAISLKGGQANKKRDSSGVQRQEPRTVLGDVQASVLNVEQVEAQDTDEDMDDKEDAEGIVEVEVEEPVKRAPIRSIFRENRLRKVGPILGGPVQARIQLFNSIFGGTAPDPEALEKTRIQRSSSVSGDSEQFLETSVKERLQKFHSLSEAKYPKPFQRTRSRNLETPSERREQRQQPTAHANQSCSSPTMPLEKQLTAKDDVSSENVKPTKMKDKPSRFSSFGAEKTLQHEERKDLEKSGGRDLLKSSCPEEARKPQDHLPGAKIPEQTTSISLQSGDKSEKQVPLPSAENANKKPDQFLLKASDHLDEPKGQELQPSSALQSVSDYFVDELDRQSTQHILPTASVSEHPEWEAQKSAVESHLPRAPSAKSQYSTLSEIRQKGIIPQSPETAQSESEHVLLPHSADETEKKETEYPSAITGLSETEPSGLSYSAKKKEDQKTPPLEIQNVLIEKQTKSEQDLSFSLQKSEEERIKLKPPIPEKTDSKYFGISYPVHTETEETQKTPAINKAVDLDHPDFSIEKNKQTENVQMEMEHPDFLYFSKKTRESERIQMETEHPDFSFPKKETAELESVQMEVEHPDFSFSREEMEKSESTQLETEHPDFSYSREETVESESSQLETEHPDFSFSREEMEKSESTQLETEHKNFSYSRGETVESESSQLETEHPAFSFSREEIEDLEKVQLETEHPDFSYSNKEIAESESGQLKMGHRDFPYSREEMEELENAQIEMGHPDFSFSREEVEKSESAQLEMKHQEFFFSGKETEKEKSIPFEMEQPECYSLEEAEQEESAQLARVSSDLSCLMKEVEKENTTEIQLVHPDIFDSTRKAETQKIGYMETTHLDLPYPMKKSKQRELAEADLDNSHASYFGDKGEQLQHVQQDSQPAGKLYSYAKGVQEETAQLHSKHLVLSHSSEKEQRHKTSQLRTEQPETSYSTGKTEQQEILQPKLEQGDSPYSQGETAQETLQRDSEGPEPLCYFSKEQQHENVQLASENKGSSFTTGEVMQEGVETESLGSSHLTDGTKPWEMAQMEQEQLLLSCSTADSQQQETPPLDVVQPDISYSSGRMEQQNIVQRQLEQQETAQQKAMQIEMEYSDLSETWQKEKPQVIDQITLAEQEIAEPELVHPSLPYSFSEKIQEEIQTEPAYQEQTFYVSTEMQEEMTQHQSEQPFPSHFTGKTEQQEIVHPELEQTLLPSSSGKEAPLEMEMSSEYLDLSYTLSKSEQKEKKLKHPTLPFHSRQQETAPLVMEHPDFSCNSGETKPGNVTEPEWGRSELSDSTRETRQSEHLDSPGTLGEEVQDERMEVESEYPNLSCSDGQRNQQKTSQLDSKYPDLLFSFSKAQEQETQKFESKHQELPKGARKRASPATAQIDSKYPDLTYSHGNPNDPEIAAWEMKHPDLSHSSDEKNQQEVVLLDQKQRKISVGREKQKQTTTQQLEQEKLSHTPGKIEQLKHAQKDLEQPDLSFSIDMSYDEMASQEAEHTDVIYPLDSTEVGQRVQDTEQTYHFGKAKRRVQPEVEIPHLAHSVGLAKEELTEPGQGGPNLPYSLSKAGGPQTVQVKPEQPVPSTCSLDKEEEMTQLGLEQPDVFYVSDKPEQLPPAQLELGHADLASPADAVGLRGMERTALACANEGQFVSRAEHPGAAEEKLGAPHASSHSGKVEQREMAETQPRHSDLPYSIDKTQTQEATQLVFGNPDISPWPGKTEQAQTAQEEQPGFLHSFKKGGQGKKAQPGLGHSQLSYSVSEAEQETTHAKSSYSDLSAGRLEHHEIIESEAEIMDLSCSIDETQQHQIAEVDLEYTDVLHSTGTEQQEENIQSEQDQPGDFSSSLSREEQWEDGGMQAEHHELQCSTGKTEGLENSQARSKYTDLSFSVGTAEPHKMTQPELKGHDLLQSFVKTKPSWAAPLESEHPDISDAMAKVQNPDLSSSISEEKPHTQLEIKQERQSYTLYPEETVRLKLQQPMFSSSHGPAEQPYRAPLEGESPEFLYSSDKKDQQEMAKQELEHSNLSYSTHKSQQQETTQLGLGQPELSSYPGNTEQPQTVQMEAEHQDLPHFTGETEWQGTAQTELEHPYLSYSSDKIEQPAATEWKSEQPVRPHPIGKTKQQGMAHPEWEHPSSSYSICETLSQEATQMDLEQQDLTYSFGKTDEIRIEQGVLGHTSSLHFSGKREQEMVSPELWHPQLSYPVRETEEKATHQKPNYPDVSYSIGQQECHEIEQPKVEEMDISYPAGNSEHSKPSQEVLQQQELLESFSKVEEKRMAQPGFLKSLSEEKQKPASQLDLVQPCLSHSLAKPEQETAQAGFVPSDFSYSTGKSEQSQPERLKSKCPDFSYPLDKEETHGMKPPDLLYSHGKEEQPQTAQLEHPETPYFTSKTEQKDGAQTELQSINLQYSVVETEQPEKTSVSYTSGRIKEHETAKLDFEQSDLLSPTDKAEKCAMALVRAGHSEKQDSGPTSSLTAQLGTEQQDFSFYTEEAESQKIQFYSSLTEQTVSFGVSHSDSETKPEGSPKSSSVTGGLSPKHLDLSYTHCKTEQSETAQPESGFFFVRKEKENLKNEQHLPLAAQSEAEHVNLPEMEGEQTPHYFRTSMQLESEQLNLPYSTDKTETLESQDYLTVPSKMESGPPAPFYSADETCQQEIPPYSKPASEYLVPTWSLAEQEKQSMQPVISQSAQSECKHVIPPHDEKELQKTQLYSPKPSSLQTVQLESASLTHTQGQDEQQPQDSLLDPKYLSSEQLINPPEFPTEQNKQEMQPDVQTVPRLVTTKSKVTTVADWQAVLSEPFAPFQTLPEKSVSVAFTDDEEKQNIPSLSDLVGMLGKQSNIISGICTEGEDRHEMQRYFADQKHASLEHLGAVSSDLVNETVMHKTQHYYEGSLSSAEMKSSISSSDETHEPDTPSFGLASWLAEEVKACSISPVRAAEVDRKEDQLSPNETADFGSKQFPAGSCTELTVHGATKNTGHMFRVSSSVSSAISYGLSSGTDHRTQRYDLSFLVGDNPGPGKVAEHETSTRNPAEMEAMKHPEEDTVSEVPEHYLKGEEEETGQASVLEGSQHAPETTEQKDLFNIISEGYEILNIHVPTHISSVDQEESKYMPDKLEYLETNPLFKRKVADDSHRAQASGTTTETSESSVLGKPANHELKELVKNDDVEETEEIQENPLLPENSDYAVLDPNNGMADMDYFEKYTLIDDKSPIKPHFERPRSLFPVTEDPNEAVEETTSFKESTEADTLEEEFSLLEDLDEVFYGTVKGESKIQSYADVSNPLPLQKSDDISSKSATTLEDEQKSPGTPLFDSEEGVLERSLLFPTTVAAVNPELLEEPPALSFLYKDLYAEAVGEKTKDETPSDEESGNSNASFPSRNSDTDDGTGIYFEKYILKDEIPSKATGPEKEQMPEDESFSGGISVQIPEDKHSQGPGNFEHVRTEVLPETSVVERGKVQVDTTCQEAGNKQEKQHNVTAVPQMEKYVPYVRAPVEDSEDDQYAPENLSCVPTIQQTEKPDIQQREEQHPDVYEDLAESMDYDVITQEELLQDEISSQLTHEELLFEDRDSFEHAGDSYEFVDESEERTPVELEDSGFVVMYPEKSATNIPQVESSQRELKKVQADTYCYHCKCPISAIDKLFGEHKDHEVTTLDDAATKMKVRINLKLLCIHQMLKFYSADQFTSVFILQENCKKNAELLEKQNEEMLKKMVAQYDEKSENFEEVKKMKMEYLYEQMVNFQQTVDAAKETLETTVKEMEELDGFTAMCFLPNRLLCAMDTTLSLEKLPSAFSLFEHYTDSPGQSNQQSLKHVAAPQTPTVIPQEPNSATSTSIAVYWSVNDGDAIDCFQVYCMEELQANKDAGALVEEYRVTVKESHCILEDLEPDHCYSVWVMAVNGTGCSLPSEKAIFKTAPSVPTIKAEDCTVCWDTATVRWCAGLASVESFTLEYCRQHSPEGEGLRSVSFAGIKRPELKVSLEPNVNYFFYLRAVNPFGTSEQSEAALISTKGTRFRLLSNTAHPALQISSNATVIRLPEKAKFTGFPSVLGELLPAQGRHYWEIIVSGCRRYRIGICYKAISQNSVLGMSDTSWCMRCCPTQTRFLHSGVMSDVRVTEHAARIGILLDYSGSRLLFFNAERGLLLFTIRHKFTDAAHPAFALEKAGVLTLCTGMELPEFVKHS
uniref:Cardiomyopathy associated 5 n=1 Tax=Amazona collaria TaxID=241587 RepID=A0A8B9FQ67_9PSIT